jgi:hypothetical protein
LAGSFDRTARDYHRAAAGHLVQSLEVVVVDNWLSRRIDPRIQVLPLL